MTVFGTVVYSSALYYLVDLIDSINQQKSEDFDVMLIVDDIAIDQLSWYIEKIRSRKVILVDKSFEGKTPAQLRICMLEEAKVRGYDLLVMGDCDDTFGEDRVWSLQQAFLADSRYAFYYNDLLLPDGTSAMGQLPAQTLSLEPILQCNYLGLSNNAINLNRLTSQWIASLAECGSFVFDWYLFSRLLILGEKGCYVENAPTYYRLHAGNFVGINRSNRDMLEKELQIKKRHYQSLVKYSDEAKLLYDKIKCLGIENINQTNTGQSLFWWSNIYL